MTGSGSKSKPLTISVLLLLAGCSAGAGSSGDAADEPRNGWSVSSEVDAMSDRTVHRAKANIAADNLDVDIEITCDSSRIGYTFTTFDKSGEPVPMRVGSAGIPTTVRLDQQPVMNMRGTAQLQNRLALIGVDPSWARASQLTLRLHTIGSEETIRFDQTDSRLRPMLDECVQTVVAARHRGEAAQAEARERGQDATNQQIKDFLAEEQGMLDQGAQALEARAKAEQQGADARSVAAERELKDRIAQEDAAQEAAVARQDAERDRRVRESIEPR
jgi:hypothetical protein